MVRRTMPGTTTETGGWRVDLLRVTDFDIPSDPIAPPGGLPPTVNLCLNLVLLRGHGRTLLVDGGFGPYTHIIPGVVEHLDERLAEAGSAREAIDTVILSHGDFDHVGGLVQGEAGGEIRPAFPNARAVCPAKVADRYRVARAGDEQEIAGPILEAWRAAGRLDEVADGHEVAPGVRLVLAEGHAPGHSVVEVGDGYVHAVDVLHHPSHLPNPEWDAGFDQDPPAGLATRMAWIERLAADGRLASFAHLDGFGRIVKDAAGARWVPAG